MNVRDVVTLSAEERVELEALVSGGAKLVRVAKRAQVLLAAADGESDERISKLVRVGTAPVYRTKRRCVEDGIEEALDERPRPSGLADEVRWLFTVERARRKMARAYPRPELATLHPLAA